MPLQTQQGGQLLMHQIASQVLWSPDERLEFHFHKGRKGVLK